MEKVQSTGQIQSEDIALVREAANTIGYQVFRTGLREELRILADRLSQPQGKVPKKELHSIEIWDMWEESGHDPYQFARAIIAASTSKDSV